MRRLHDGGDWGDRWLCRAFSPKTFISSSFRNVRVVRTIPFNVNLHF
jgi:hypothetical protein